MMTVTHLIHQTPAGLITPACCFHAHRCDPEPEHTQTRTFSRPTRKCEEMQPSARGLKSVNERQQELKTWSVLVRTCDVTLCERRELNASQARITDIRVMVITIRDTPPPRRKSCSSDELSVFLLQGWRAWTTTPSWWLLPASWFGSWWTETGRGKTSSLVLALLVRVRPGARFGPRAASVCVSVRTADFSD